MSKLDDAREKWPAAINELVIGATAADGQKAPVVHGRHAVCPSSFWKVPASHG